MKTELLKAKLEMRIDADTPTAEWVFELLWPVIEASACLAYHDGNLSDFMETFAELEEKLK